MTTTGHPRTVRRKLLGIVLLTTLAALTVAVVLISAYNLRAHHHQLEASLTTQAELLGYMTAPALSFDDQALAQRNLALLRLQPEVSDATLYAADGRLFARHDPSRGPFERPRLPLRDEVRIEGPMLVVFKRIVSDGELLGTIHLRAEHRLLGQGLALLGIGLSVTLLAMTVAYLLASRLQRVVTQPILQIAEVAREVVGRSDDSRRAAITSDDEVGELAASFNGMLSEIGRRTRELERSNLEIAREVGERSRAQQEVMRLNADLELRVRDRTLQLEASNRELADAKASAEGANQAKSEFLSSMSHELRTPLNAILGFAQLLEEEDPQLPPPKRQDFVRYILRAGNHLLTLINEVLDLAKVESGTLTLSMEPVSLAELLHECEDMIRPAADAQRLKLVFAHDEGLHVHADRTRLKQVLLNLLSNAVKYNRQGGSVVVGASWIDARRVRISIQDTGRGLDTGQLAQLFQPFNRLGQEAGPEQGSGIGLVVTKRLVELMAGQIGLSSTVGVGTVFWLDMKGTERVQLESVAESPGEAGGRPAATPPAHPGESLLYVEDNPANLRLVQEIVALRTELRLITAANGTLGLATAREQRPEVILMDVNLPGIDGVEAMKILQREPATRHIPVIALTANAMPRDIEKGLAAGFFRYLTKPIDVQEFLAAIEEALAHGRSERAGRSVASPSET